MAVNSPLLGRRLLARDDSPAWGVREGIDFLLKKWRSLALFVVVSIMAALGLLAVISPRYSATAELLVEGPSTVTLLRGGPVGPESVADTNTAIENTIAVLRSRHLLGQIIKDRDLTKDPEFVAQDDQPTFAFLAPIQDFIRGLLRQSGQSQEGSLDAETRKFEQTLIALEERFAIERLGRTSGVSITFSSKDPVKAAALANDLASTFIRDQAANRSATAQQGLRWINERLEAMREQLRRSEEKVTEFRTAHNLTRPSASASSASLLDQQLSELNSRLGVARGETAERQTRYESAAKVKASGGDLAALPDVMRSTTVQRLRDQYADMTRRLTEMVRLYGQDNPAVTTLRADMDQVQRAIGDEADRIIDGLRIEYEIAKAREVSLSKSLEAVRERAAEDEKLSIQLRELEREAAANRTAVESLLARMSGVEDQASLSLTSARQISMASPPLYPTWPRKSLILFLAVSTGLGLGVAYSALREIFRETFRSPQQVESELGLQVLGVVREFSTSRLFANAASKNPFLQPATRGVRQLAEAFRRLGVEIGLTRSDSQNRIVQFASAMPKEGKTAAALGFALFAASEGRKVLVIDGDAQHRGMSKILGVGNRPGLSDTLRGEVTPQQAVVSCGSGISILPAGHSRSAMFGDLDPTNLRKVLDELSPNYDQIIVDSAALTSSSDARITAQAVQKVIVAVRWSETERDLVAKSVKMLLLHSTVLGIVMTRVGQSGQRRAERDEFRLYSPTP